MSFRIVVIPGDGIGPEATEQGVLVLKEVGQKYGIDFTFEEALAGGCAIDREGVPLPKKTLQACLSSDAVLLGAVGGPAWDHLASKMRPEKALLGLREGLHLFANIRPAFLHRSLEDACPLKLEITRSRIDICIVRELTGGIYFGKQGLKQTRAGWQAFDTAVYSDKEVSRIARKAFQTASLRRKKVTSVDKANILESSRLWRNVVEKTSKDYPEITLEHMLVDNAAMQLIRDPNQFDVILTTNMFGDILSDEAAMLTGSIGMLPSASLGEKKPGLYEPVHGSAPDIAGQDKANPIAIILSTAMMLRYSFSLEKEAAEVEKAVTSVLEKGYRTEDIQSSDTSVVGTQEMGRLIRKEIGVKHEQ